MKPIITAFITFLGIFVTTLGASYYFNRILDSKNIVPCFGLAFVVGSMLWVFLELHAEFGSDITIGKKRHRR